ncbi:MAG: tetratricopeptide repeat protein, partial [Acidobacteriales bacterium]|nr:tetratricopeptide repeat protein [Terriglobales bacterium]
MKQAGAVMVTGNTVRRISMPSNSVTRGVVILFAAASLVSVARANSQTNGKTVRHHRAEENSTPADVAKAEEAIEKRDYPAAEALLKKVVAGDPADYQAWFDLGFTYNALGRGGEAIEAYRKSVAAKSDVFESNLNLGLMLAKTGDPEAEVFLRSATTLKPSAQIQEGQEHAWLSLAHVIEATKPDQAIAAYRRAEDLQPNDAEPYISAGMLLAKLNRLDEAREQYSRAVALAPHSDDALAGLADLYLRQGRFVEAQDALRRLLAGRPNDVRATALLGRALAASGKSDEAVAQLEAAQKLAPEDRAIKEDLADLYSSTGKYGEAEVQYRALLSAQPNNAELHHGLGKSLLNQRRFPEAQQELLIAVKLKPDLGSAYGDLAAAANENKDYQLAIRATDA